MTLFNALHQTARLLEDVHESLATGGTTSTLVDTTLNFNDSWWTGGTLFIHTGALAGRTIKVTGYNNTTKTVSFAAQTSAIVAGVRYSLARAHFDRQLLVDAINAALGELGTVTQINTALLVTADTTDYTLPAGVANLVRVDTTADLVAPITWSNSHFWREDAGSLRFDNGKAPTEVGAAIRVFYNLPHAEVSADADVIALAINPARLAWSAAYYAVLQRSKVVSNDERLKDFLKMAAGNKAALEIQYPVVKMQPTPKLATY